MIQPLRSVHRRVFLALAVVAPAIFVAGLLARHRVLPERRATVGRPALPNVDPEETARGIREPGIKP